MKKSICLAALTALLLGCVTTPELNDGELISAGREIDRQIKRGMSLNDIQKLTGSKGDKLVWGRTSGQFQFAIQKNLVVLGYFLKNDSGYELLDHTVYMYKPKWDGKTIHTRMSEAEVQKEVLAYLSRTKDFDFKNYPKAYPQIGEGGMRWTMVFQRVPNRFPGDHFLILVDDATGRLEERSGI